MDTNRILRLSSALLLATTAIGCRSSASLEASDDHAVIVMQRTELFLGLKRPSDPDISDGQFQAFLEEEVTPRFPGGYTVVPAEGRWRGGGPGDVPHTIREPSRLLIILYEPTVQSDKKIEQIRDARTSSDSNRKRCCAAIRRSRFLFNLLLASPLAPKFPVVAKSRLTLRSQYVRIAGCA